MPLRRSVAAPICCLLAMAAGCQAEPKRAAQPGPMPHAAEQAQAAARGTATGAVAADAGPAEVEVAKKLYSARCQVCHGPSGLGDGPMGASLRPAPRSFADAAWQAKATDADIANIIVQGGASVGRSAAMPAAPDLKNKPSVVAGLVRVVRQFGNGS